MENLLEKIVTDFATFKNYFPNVSITNELFYSLEIEERVKLMEACMEEVGGPFPIEK